MREIRCRQAYYGPSRRSGELLLCHKFYLSFRGARRNCVPRARGFFNCRMKMGPVAGGDLSFRFDKASNMSSPNAEDFFDAAPCGARHPIAISCIGVRGNFSKTSKVVS